MVSICFDFNKKVKLDWQSFGLYFVSVYFCWRLWRDNLQFRSGRCLISLCALCFVCLNYGNICEMIKNIKHKNHFLYYQKYQIFNHKKSHWIKFQKILKNRKLQHQMSLQKVLVKTQLNTNTVKHFCQI